MIKDILAPKRFKSPEIELIEAKATNTFATLRIINSFVGQNPSADELDATRRGNGFYIRPTAGLESMDKVLPIVFAASPAIRLLRGYSKTPGIVDRLMFFSIHDTKNKKMIGFSSIEQQSDNPSEVEITLYMAPSFQRLGYGQKALSLVLQGAQEIFHATEVKGVSGTPGGQGLCKKLGFDLIGTDTAPDKRGLRSIYSQSIPVLLERLSA